jgi:hypothetical protein
VKEQTMLRITLIWIALSFASCASSPQVNPYVHVPVTLPKHYSHTQLTYKESIQFQREQLAKFPREKQLELLANPQYLSNRYMVLSAQVLLSKEIKSIGDFWEFFLSIEDSDLIDAQKSLLYKVFRMIFEGANDTDWERVARYQSHQRQLNEIKEVIE